MADDRGRDASVRTESCWNDCLKEGRHSCQVARVFDRLLGSGPTHCRELFPAKPASFPQGRTCKRRRSKRLPRLSLTSAALRHWESRSPFRDYNQKGENCNSRTGERTPLPANYSDFIHDQNDHGRQRDPSGQRVTSEEVQGRPRPAGASGY